MPEHWEMAQRDNLQYGAPNGTPPVPFEPEKYLTNESLITMNFALDFAWARSMIVQRWAAIGLPLQQPAINWQLSALFVFNRTVPSNSRWLRYQQYMDPYLLRDDLGNPIPYPKVTLPPGQPYPAEPGWAIDPRLGAFEAMTRFAIQEYDALVPPPDSRCGYFLDSASTAIYKRWLMMMPTMTPTEWKAVRESFIVGRNHFLRELRGRYGESIILTCNWGKDRLTRPHETWAWTNGTTYEGCPTYPEHRPWIRRHWWQNVQGGRTTYAVLWNDYPSLSPAPPIFDYMARHGSHWAERNGGPTKTEGEAPEPPRGRG